MKQFIRVSIIIGVVSFLGNCVNIGNPQGFGPTGMLFNSYKVGISGSNNVKAQKEGKACVLKISVFLTTGNASIEEAAASAGITRISSVSKEGLGFITPYIFHRLCTIVRGD